MKNNSIFFILVCFIINTSCNNYNKEINNDMYIELFGENIKLYGNPTKEILSQYINGDVNRVYPLNTKFYLSVILEAPAIYHCFILEIIGDEKQLSYLKIDDGMKYNYIPYYDSLEYDYNYSYFDYKFGRFPSSKFDSIPLFREKSEEYNKLISTCDDVQEFTDFYNNSLFFQYDTTVISYEFKEDLQNKLINILLIRFVESVGDENVLFYDKVSCIFHNPPDFYDENLDEHGLIVDYLDFAKEVACDTTSELLFSYSSQIVLNKKYYIFLYNDINNKSTEIYNYYKNNYKIHKYELKYIFIYKVEKKENNKISIERNFINHNFLLPPKFSCYK